jgi:hypothetical protein
VGGQGEGGGEEEEEWGVREKEGEGEWKSLMHYCREGVGEFATKHFNEEPVSV